MFKNSTNLKSITNVSKKNHAKNIALIAIITAIYATVTLVMSFSSYGLIQFRIAEGLTVLPYFSPYAIIGLFAGCILSNIISPMGLPDLIFGSLATFIAAIITYYIGKSNLKYKKLLAPLPSVIVNAIIIGTMLKLLYVKDIPIYLAMLQVGIGQLICCYGIGIPILNIVEKYSLIKK